MKRLICFFMCHKYKKVNLMTRKSHGGVQDCVVFAICERCRYVRFGAPIGIDEL